MRRPFRPAAKDRPRDALEGFLYVENNDPSSLGYSLTPLGAAERLKALPADTAGDILGLWIESLAGKPPSAAEYRFLSETLSQLQTQDPAKFATIMVDLFQTSPAGFEQAAVAFRDRGDFTLIGHTIEALPVAERAEFFQNRVDIADPQELYTFLANGQSRIFNALSPDAKGETLQYMLGGQDGTSPLQNARVDEYVYFDQTVSEEVQVANNVWIAAPTVQRGGIDTIVVYVEGNADVPAGYYSIGLVEENEIADFRLIDGDGEIIQGYTVRPPVDNPDAGNWQIESSQHGRALFAFSDAPRRIAFQTRPLTLLNFSGTGTTTGRYVGGNRGGANGLGWQDRFITQRPITADQSNEAFNGQQPLPTLGSFGVAGENLSTTEALAFLIGLAPSQVTPEIQAELATLTNDDGRNTAFQDLISGDHFTGDKVVNGQGENDPVFRYGMRTWLERSVLNDGLLEKGFVTPEQRADYEERYNDVVDLFESGDTFGAFVAFAKLVVEGNKVKLAADYAFSHPGTTPQEAMAYVAPVFEPYEALTDEELVAVSIYGGLDQGAYSGANVGESGYFYTAFNETFRNGTAEERAELAPFAAVLHVALEKINASQAEILPLLNEITNGAYGKPDANGQQTIVRGITVDDPALLDYFANLQPGEAWNDDHRFSSSSGGEQLAYPWRDANVIIMIKSDKTGLISPVTLSGQDLREFLLSSGYTLVVAEPPVYRDDGKLVITLTTSDEAVSNATIPDPAPTTETPVTIDTDYALYDLGLLVDKILQDPIVDEATRHYADDVDRTDIKSLVNFLYLAKYDPSVAQAVADWTADPKSRQVLDYVLANADSLGLNPVAVTFLENILRP